MSGKEGEEHLTYQDFYRDVKKDDENIEQSKNVQNKQNEQQNK